MKAMVTAYSKSGTITGVVVMEDPRYVYPCSVIDASDGFSIWVDRGGRIEIEATPEEIPVSL